MNTSEASRAVSPVVGVILVVAITVALSGVVGVFVFDVGQSVSNGNTQSDIATRTTFNADGTADIQVVTGEADTLRIVVNGTESNTIQTPSPGDSLTVTATPESRITVISEMDGASTVVTTSNSGVAGPTAPTQGLIAHWELDGDATDTSGSNHGTVNGAVFVPSYRDGQAAQFDGTDDSITANEVSAGDDFTWSVWFNADTTGADNRLMDHRGSDFYIIPNIGRSGTDTLGFYDGTDHAVRTITTGTWYHYVIVYNNTDREYDAYVNGTLEKTVSGTKNTATGGLTLGADDISGADFFDGLIDDVRIYDRDLSREEVGDLYNATK